MEKEQKVLGTTPIGEFTEEELKAERKRIVEEKISIIRDLNKIRYPLQVTVFAHGKPWSIRNEEFWKVFKKGDEDVMDFMLRYLMEEKS